MFRFMSIHITELHEIVKNSSSKEKQLDWGSVEDRIKDQIPLRAVTCIQLASKLVSHYKVRKQMISIYSSVFKIRVKNHCGGEIFEDSFRSYVTRLYQ